MRLKKGSERIVFVIPRLGIVIKFPAIRILHAIKLIWRYRKDWENLKRIWQYPVWFSPALKGLLFKGIYANLGEAWFWWKTRHPFVQPTYVSLFGLLNIQRCGEACTFGSEEMWRQFYDLTNGDVFEDSHHFVNPRNFCLHDGRLRMLDYGSAASRDVIVRHGMTILQSFKLPP